MSEPLHDDALVAALPCGGWAVYFFPLAGGIRRCGACAAREGRLREFPKR